MSEQKHNVHSCSTIQDFEEFKPKDASFPRGNPAWHSIQKNPKQQMSGQSGVHIIPNHKEKDKSNIFFFSTIHQECCQGSQVWEDKGVCIQMKRRKCTNLLLPRTRVFTLQHINTRSYNTDFLKLYIVLWRSNPLFVTRIFTLFPLHPNKKVSISTISISVENKDVSLLHLAQTSLMRASFFHLNNLILASTGTRLLNQRSNSCVLASVPLKIYL